mmetsp:Transcript_22818/g.26837  ORF Transcript_22818/g.26837 Transcript_22818/m.26837 type:complete len:428 (+) Transcript_22818:16-1299(+)
MASFNKRGISAPMLSPTSKLDSFEEMNSTYVSPDASMKINAKGVRGEDGSYIDSVDPQKLVVLEELGRGASAVVKRAGQRDSSDQYVVKCFNMYDSNKRRMLREEMKLLMAMNSPSVVKFHGAFLDSSQKICVVLEFMDKGDLENLVTYTRSNNIIFPENILCSMTYQIVQGLHYLNSSGFMHRDIKPPNLLINSRGQVKITDFGIGRRLSDAHSGLSGAMTEDDNEEDGDEMANTFVGTRVYMSIERLKGEKYSASADVWSLGLVVCEALLDQHPLLTANESFASLIGTLQEVEAREEEGVETMGICLDGQPNLSDEMRAFVDWCLAIDPSIRATPEDCVDDDWFTLHLGEGTGDFKASQAVERLGAWMQLDSMVDYIPTKEPEYIHLDFSGGEAISDPMSLDHTNDSIVEEDTDGQIQTIDSDED